MQWLFLIFGIVDLVFSAYWVKHAKEKDKFRSIFSLCGGIILTLCGIMLSFSLYTPSQRNIDVHLNLSDEVYKESTVFNLFNDSINVNTSVDDIEGLLGKTYNRYNYDHDFLMNYANKGYSLCNIDCTNIVVSFTNKGQLKSIAWIKENPTETMKETTLKYLISILGEPHNGNPQKQDVNCSWTGYRYSTSSGNTNRIYFSSLRERVIFAEQYNEILGAIKNRRALSFFTTLSGERKYTIAPYAISPSKDEQYNYVLCYDLETKTVRSFRLSRIRRLFVLTESFHLEQTTIDSLKRAKEKGPQFAFVDSIKSYVRLTENGFRKYRMIYTNRPEIADRDGDVLIFEWPLLQLEEYFKRFGKDAEILEPMSAREKMIQFYGEAYEHYLNN